MGSGGFEPPKSKTADLQSAPFGHSGNCPAYIRPVICDVLYNILKKLIANQLINNRNALSQWRDSNPRPADYKSAALAN